LLKYPEKLKSSIRPKSGKFYTYPYYGKDLESLLEAIKRTEGTRPTNKQNAQPNQ